MGFVDQCFGFGFVDAGQGHFQRHVERKALALRILAVADMRGNGALIFLVIGVAAAPACILWDLIARRSGEFVVLLAVLASVFTLALAWRHLAGQP